MVDREETNIGAHALLLTKDNMIILQQRTSGLGVVNPGKISMFGGTLKSKERILDGLKRELQEELELNIDNYEIEKLGKYIKTKRADGVDYVIYVYLVKEINPKKIKINEGEGYVLDEPSNLIKNPKITRITKLALKDLLNK